MTDGDRTGPVLDGLRILDAGTMIAGPFAGTLAADHGAEVIKIEKPGLGDPMRRWAPIKNGVSLWWKVGGRNKRLITLDLASERGREVFLQLVERSDAVIENFRPGTFERWGLSYEELAEVNQRVILVRVSGYGQTGPYAHRPGYGTVAEAMTGIPAFTGPSDGPPTLSAIPLADAVAATFALSALLGAVYERDVAGSGRGQVVDVSLYEPLFRLVESQVVGYDQLGIVKRRQGNRIAEDSPRNAYETSDGEWIAISASSDRTFARLAVAIGRSELAEDPRFRDNRGRMDNDEELDGIIRDWMAERTAQEIMDLLSEGDVVAGPVLDIAGIFNDPQYAARENIVTVDDPDVGPLKMPGIVPRFSRSDAELWRSGAAMGEDNDLVYRDLLGISAGELDAMKSEGTI